jgi:hypothetical protein
LVPEGHVVRLLGFTEECLGCCALLKGAHFSPSVEHELVLPPASNEAAISFNGNPHCIKELLHYLDIVRSPIIISVYISRAKEKEL